MLNESILLKGIIRNDSKTITYYILFIELGSNDTRNNDSTFIWVKESITIIHNLLNTVKYPFIWFNCTVINYDSTYA